MQKQHTTPVMSTSPLYGEIIQQWPRPIPVRVRTYFPIRRYTIRVVSITGITIAVAIVSYLWYWRRDDISPDSLFGLAYAWAALACLLAALTLYTLHRRRARKRIGSLNKSLQWHMSLGTIGIALALMHSFNNFNMRTGTYVLYGLLALVISGGVGKVLDRYVSRLVAIEAKKTLTQNGKTELIVTTHHLRGLSDSTQHARPATTRKLEETLVYEYEQTASPFAYMSLEELQEMKRTIRREYFFRAFIRVWRRVHIFLALLTVALVCWHIVFAVSLWIH